MRPKVLTHCNRALIPESASSAAVSAMAFSNPASRHRVNAASSPAHVPSRRKPVTRRRKIILLTPAFAVAGLALGAARARDVPKVATGFIADVLCSETFVSGLDPQRNLAETIDAMPGAGLLSWAMDYQVNRARKDVTVTLFGIGRSHAVYREGLGCTLEPGG